MLLPRQHDRHLIRALPLLAAALLLGVPGPPPLAAEVTVQQRTVGPTPQPGGAGRILGSVVDAEDAALPAVAVTLRQAVDSSLVTGVVTDEAGRFRFEELPAGDYLLHVGRIGFVSRTSEVISLSMETPMVDLGSIRLVVAAVALDGVEALVDRPSVVVEADRTVYDVRQMPVAGAGAATDVLRSVPELEVDVDDNVRTRGNQPAAIHLNGRPLPIRGEQLTTFLRQLPGDRIDRIEVLPNPSARHDPEGMGGIVNIVLRDDVEIGLSGSINLTASSRGRQALGGRFNVQRGSLTLFSGVGINRMQMDSESWSLRTNLVTNPVTLTEQASLMDNTSRGWNADWTAEWALGEGNTLWSNAYLFNSGGGGRTSTNYGISDAAENLRESYDREMERDSDSGNYNLQGGFRRVLDPRREEFSVDARYSTGANDGLNTSARLFHVMGGEPVDLPTELTLNDVASGTGNLSIQADYFRPVFGDGRLEVGYRAWQRDQDNDNLLRIFETLTAPDPFEHTRSGYDYTERFHSLYTTLALTRGRLRAQGGLRGEFSATTFDSRIMEEKFERDYRSLFPSGNVAFEVRPGRTVRVLYARRISRPPPFYLDPFVPSTDPLNVFRGNPALEPSHARTWTLDLTVNGQRGTLRMAPYHTHSTDVWERIRTVDEAGVSTSRWENTATSRTVGTNVTVSLRPMGRFSGSTNFAVYRESRDGSNIRADLTGSAMMWRVGGNLGIRLQETLTAQVMANRFPMQSVLQGRASAYTFMQVALRRQVLDNRGNVSLMVSDPFNMNRFDSSVQDPTFTMLSRSSNPSRMISLGFTVNLGQTPQRQSRPSGGPEAGGGETIRVP
ncbi:MAG: TonB-dependent receptor [Gemmatimonadales bacterium]|nr:MAG: TonB-dependent receptor [Gemmatimonadales bacterium]